MIRAISIVAALVMTVAMHPLTWATLEGASWLSQIRPLMLDLPGLIGPVLPSNPQVRS
jgi:hypothetical protein